MSAQGNQAGQGQQLSNQQSSSQQGQPAQQNASSPGILTAANVGHLQHDLESLRRAGSQGLREGTPPPGYTTPTRPTNAPHPMNRPPPLFPINSGRAGVPPVNYFPQPQGNGSSSSEDEPASQRNGTFRLTVHGGVQVQGHGSMVGIDPTNPATLTTDVVRMLGEQGLFSEPQQQQDDNGNPATRRRRPQHFQININSGVSVVGNNNIVGSNLEDVVKYRRPTPQSSPGPSRQVSGALSSPDQASAPLAPGSRQFSGSPPGQTQPQVTQRQQGGGVPGNTQGGAPGNTQGGAPGNTQGGAPGNTQGGAPLPNNNLGL